MAKVAFDDFSRVGPGRIRMREVVRPHDVVLAPIFQIFAANVIVEEAGKYLIFDEAARIARERRGVLFLKAIVIIIPLLKHPGHPAAFVFHRDDLELRISFQYAVKNELKERVGDIHELQVDAAAVALDAFSVLILVVTVAGQNMQTHGSIELLARGPEFVVMTGVKGEIGMGCLPNNRALESRFVASLELFDAVIDVIDRNGRNADEPIRIDAAVVDKPVIVDAKASFLQTGIIESEEIEHQGRIKHFS